MSGLEASVLRGWEPLFAHSHEWHEILRSSCNRVDGPDATASPTWARALAATRLKDAAVDTAVVARDGRIVALAPTFRRSGGSFPLRQRELRLITEAHAGRTNLLVENDDPAVTELLLSQLMRGVPPWDVFVLSVVKDSRGHAALVRAAASLGVPLRTLAAHSSPYIELEPSWDALLAALPKKMRWTIRKSEKSLAELGEVTYEEVTTPDRAGPLLAAIYEIEQKSWKEQSGTSITAQAGQRAFYEALVPEAARAGILSGHVLRLDGKPIAYILGIAAGDGVFLDQKESFDLAYSEHSPGHVLKHFAIDRLLSRGVSLYDLMGECEPYKMRWTSKTYTRLTLALYNRTLGGRLGLLRSGLRRQPVAQ